MNDLNAGSIDRLISATEKRLKALKDLRSTFGTDNSSTVKGKTKESAAKPKGKASGSKGKAATPAASPKPAGKSGPPVGTIRRGSQNEKILLFLEQAPAPRAAILTATGVSSKSIGPILAMLAQRGFVSRSEDGLYSRTDKVPTYVGEVPGEPQPTPAPEALTPPAEEPKPELVEEPAGA